MAVEIEQVKLLLNNILSEWDHFLTHMQNLTKEELEEDLFAQINYLTQVEDANARISMQLVNLEESIDQINNSDHRSIKKDDLYQRNLLNVEFQQILQRVQPNLKIAQDSYNEMVKEVLGRSQDLVAELIDKTMQPSHGSISLKERIGLELDEESKLRELQDSLGAFRECRLENMDEDGDPIIDKLDFLIRACDSALQMEE